MITVGLCCLIGITISYLCWFVFDFGLLLIVILGYMFNSVVLFLCYRYDLFCLLWFICICLAWWFFLGFF